MSGAELKYPLEQIDQLRGEVLTFACYALQKLNPDGAVVTEQTDITTDLNLDSVAIMDLVFSLEEKFDLSIPLNDLADIYKVGELTDLVCALKKGQ